MEIFTSYALCNFGMKFLSLIMAYASVVLPEEGEEEKVWHFMLQLAQQKLWTTFHFDLFYAAT